MSIEKSVDELTLYDPKLLKRVMGVSNEAMEVILNSILGTVVNRSDFEVLEVLTRKIEYDDYDDVMQYIAFVQDSKGENYEIELQVIDGEDAYNRSMWYLFNLIQNRMRLRFSGYCMLQSYVIILNKEDMVGGNQPYYLSKVEGTATHFAGSKEAAEEIDLEKDDFLGIKNCFPPCIFINGNLKDESPLGKLLSDFESTNPDDFTFPALAESVKEAKNSIIE